MLSQKSDELDAYIPELSQPAFRRKVMQWIETSESKSKGYCIRTSAKVYGTMLYKDSWDLLEMLHQIAAADSKEAEEEDIEQDTLFYESKSGPSPIDVHYVLKLLRNRFKEQKTLCNIYGK